MWILWFKEIVTVTTKEDLTQKTTFDATTEVIDFKPKVKGSVSFKTKHKASENIGHVSVCGARAFRHFERRVRARSRPVWVKVTELEWSQYSIGINCYSLNEFAKVNVNVMI